MNKLKYVLKFLIAILWLPLLIWIFKDSILDFIQNRETLNAIYQFCISEIQAKTYIGAGILVFIGSLFFIMFLPRYAVFIYFSVTGDLNHIILILFSATAFFLAMIVNYILGVLIGRLLPRRYIERVEDLLYSRWSSAIVFGGYLIPLFFPHKIIGVVAGSTKFSFKWFAVLSAVGCVLHFIILHIMQNLLVPYVKIFEFS